MQLAVVPGHVDVQSAEELRRNILSATVDSVIKGLTGETNGHSFAEPQPAANEIVFSGNFEEINRFFYENDMERRPTDRTTDDRKGGRVSALYPAAT
jgi:hypothetical protein